jgi:solute carrier family 35 protein E1
VHSVVKSKHANNNGLLQSQALFTAEGHDIVAEAPKKSLIDTIWNKDTQLVAYLTVWYVGNVAYNIYNKKACNALGKDSHGHANAHWALSAVQLLVGVIFVIPMWLTGVRKAPDMTADNWKEMAPIGLFASLAHAFSVLALGAGAVSFGQIVKAGEPVFAAATNALLLKEIDHPIVYAALLPIIGGVGLASLKELSFTWTALIAASAANQAAALKNVVSKGVMNKPWAKALGPQNGYSVVTILALLFTLPLVLAFDLKDFGAVYKQVMAAKAGPDVLKYSLFSGLSFYLYNEASFLALDRLDAVTHSVANTLKRVVIIVASCVVFKTPMTLLGGIGSGVAVLGTFLYSMAKKKYSKSASKH